jgi:MGT family glycosyltransferase
MSRILAYSSPAHGHLFPLAAVLEELRRRGHDVALRTLAGEVEGMRARGFEAEAIAPEAEAIAMDDWKARTPPGASKRALEVFLARARYDAPDLRAAIAAERPDAVLVDVLTWGALGAAEAWGGPWACFCPFPLMLHSRVGPPSGLGLRPAAGPLGRLRDRALRPLLRAGFDRASLRGLNEVRARLGLSPFAHTEELFLAPPLLIYMSAEPFEYPRPDWPERIVEVGPCLWEPPGELPAELHEVDLPLVLVTSSTEFQDDGRLVRTALEALDGEPIHVVATLPAASEAGLEAPANATILRFAPHTPILERSACAITHGGMGATQKALALGVPVCAVPFARDQPEVARRVEVAGAGSRLPAWRLRPDRLRTKVHEAIASKAGAERVAAGFAAAGGAAAAADAFERRLLAR